MNTVSTKQQAPSRNSNPASCLLPPAHNSRGFALLVAVIFTSVMLSFGLALGSLAYKQQVLASSATESQYAFYAADAGLECALYYDQQVGRFMYPATDPEITGTPSPIMTCNGSVAISSSDEWFSSPTAKWIVKNQLNLFNGSRCADITVYKYATGVTYLFSQGYDVPCTTVNAGGARFVSRGIHAQY